MGEFVMSEVFDQRLQQFVYALGHLLAATGEGAGRAKLKAPMTYNF